MGAGPSALCSDNKLDRTSSVPGRVLDDVPESCVAGILMCLDPPDICKLAGLSRAFHGASLADFVWETKLPCNYKFLVERVFQETTEAKPKKETYARLCQPNFFDGDTKLAWLDKNSGKLGVSISYKALRITGIDDRRYWSHISSPESRFNAIAYLHQTWWLEVMGELEFQFPPGNYSLFFRLHLGKPSNNNPNRLSRWNRNTNQVHGWDIKPVRFQLSASNGQQAVSQCYLQESSNWVHYHVGDVGVDDLGSPELKIKFSMMQIDCTHTKGGLCLDSVLICPSEFKGCFFNLF